MGKRGVLLLTAIALAAAVLLMVAADLGRAVLLPQGPSFESILETDYDVSCLSVDQPVRPVGECYQVPLARDVAAYREVVLTHSEGLKHRTLTFLLDGRPHFRFTPERKGRWCYALAAPGASDDAQCVTINRERPAYARGFVTATGAKWTRSGDGRAFIPQFVMYDKPDIERGLEVFVDGHGFTGFHITNLRDFLAHPEYFEAVVLRTYRAGGVTHFWLWGDEHRGLTPATYGVDVERLYREIAARLYPLPGWTLGYGFDLYEWTERGEISGFKQYMNALTSYRHMIGGRGAKNAYKPVDDGLDYASWEWHQPGYEDYLEHLRQADGIPAFSEDRFRIRPDNAFGHKDYNLERTRRGLWHALFAGGVANIWGYRAENGAYSLPYPNRAQLEYYRQFVDRYYSLDTKPTRPLIDGAICIQLGDEVAADYACYLEGAEGAHALPEPASVAADTLVDLRSLRETDLSGATAKIELPRASDWLVLLSRR